MRADSAGHSIKASDGSVLQVTQVEMSPKMTVFVILLAVVVAASIAVNAACLWQISNAERETRLKEYDLSYFRSTDFAAVKAQVDQDRRELDTLKIQFALRQELDHGKPRRR